MVRIYWILSGIQYTNSQVLKILSYPSEKTFNASGACLLWDISGFYLGLIGPQSGHNYSAEGVNSC